MCPHHLTAGERGNPRAGGSRRGILPPTLSGEVYSRGGVTEGDCSGLNSLRLCEMWGLFFFIPSPMSSTNTSGSVVYFWMLGINTFICILP